MANPEHTNKRKKVDSDDEVEADNFPRFLVIQNSDPDKPLKLSPFAINKGVESLAGAVKAVKRLRSGDILVEVERVGQAKNLLKADKFVNIPVKVSPHKTLNSCRGVVRCPDLRDCSDEEILDELADQQVTGVHRVVISQNGEKKPTNTLFLTFRRTSIPPFIKVGYLRVKVDMYIPNPMRCFNCQRFGHFRSFCKRAECCEKCGKEGHAGAACQEPAKCINCNGSHSANSRACPKWVEERKIQELKAQNCITYPEARKLYQAQQPQGPTYADKTRHGVGVNTQQPKAPKVTKSSKSTQTSFTWLSRVSPVLVNDQINTASSRTQTKTQDQEKKGQTKTKDGFRRSRSLSRDPPTRSTVSGNQDAKKTPPKNKGRQPSVVKTNLTDSVMTKNKYGILTIEGDEEMDISLTQPSSKIKLVSNFDNT